MIVLNDIYISTGCDKCIYINEFTKTSQLPFISSSEQKEKEVPERILSITSSLFIVSEGKALEIATDRKIIYNCYT